jgi:hypothetical protein
MKFKPLYLCLLVWLQVAVGMRAATAATVRFNPDANSVEGTLVGRVFLNKMGGLKLPRGRAVFKGNSVDITIVPEFQFDRVVVLSGALVSVHSDINGQQAAFNGIVYFFEGDWLKYIDDPHTPDSVATASGTITGRIRGIGANALEVEESNGSRKSIPLSTLISIRSPRAFDFSLPATAFTPQVPNQPFTADATLLSLTPSANVFQLKALKHDRLMQTDGDLSTGKLILIGAAYTTAQLAQLVPFLVVPLDGRHLITNANAKLNRFFTESNFQAQNGIPTPVPPSGVHNVSPGG